MPTDEVQTIHDAVDGYGEIHSPTGKQTQVKAARGLHGVGRMGAQDALACCIKVEMPVVGEAHVQLLCIHLGRLKPQLLRVQFVVSIQKLYIFASGSTQSHVSCCGGTAIGFPYQAESLVLLDEVVGYLCRRVGASVIYDDALEVLKGLLLQSFKSLQQKFCLIITGYDDAYFWQGVLAFVVSSSASIMAVG